MIIMVQLHYNYNSMDILLFVSQALPGNLMHNCMEEGFIEFS